MPGKFRQGKGPADGDRNASAFSDRCLRARRIPQLWLEPPMRSILREWLGIEYLRARFEMCPFFKYSSVAAGYLSSRFKPANVSLRSSVEQSNSRSDG